MSPETSATPSARTRAREAREESRARIMAAATELVRQRSYAALSVGEIMDKAGIGRTLFYRYFDDLDDLLARASTEAVAGLHDAAMKLGAAGGGGGEEEIRAAMAATVEVYRRHGPVLRALAEAGAGDPQIAAGREAFRRRFDEIVAGMLGEMPEVAANPPADIGETAHALNLLIAGYLLDAYGYEPRIPVETAAQTLAEIWLGTIRRSPATDPTPPGP